MRLSVICPFLPDGKLPRLTFGVQMHVKDLLRHPRWLVEAGL